MYLNILEDRLTWTLINKWKYKATRNKYYAGLNKYYDPERTLSVSDVAAGAFEYYATPDVN